MNISLLRLSLALCLTLVIFSCATKSIQTASRIPFSEKEGEYRSFFLLGNLGVNQAQDPEVFKAIIADISSKANDNDYTLILGDNVKS